MSYQVGQAVILENDSLLFAKLGGFENILGQDCVMSDSAYHYSRPATEAEILAEAVKHGWKQTNSKWLYVSPSGQLELMDNDGWTPVIKRQPLSDQFGFFGQECITAHRLITALNLAK
jgi:hypothetical protein